ncbi:MAG: hypothetical protein VXW97_03315 [Pseudomonadota bacterium]|nr:hypothetical protein [Pseudomonadota bacterium]
MLDEVRKKKLFLFIFCIFFSAESYLFSENTDALEFECLSETRVSGLFQNQRKFLKNSEFFPYKTIMSFTNDYKNLKEKDNSAKNITEAKYNYECKKNKSNALISCSPLGAVKAYEIKFSLETLRYRKSLLTNFWIEGKGNEVDYINLSLGYCYRINN